MTPTVHGFAVWTRRVLVTLITSGAFLNSYGHTVQWFRDHHQMDHAKMLGFMPEAGVVVLVLSLVLGRMNLSTKLITGSFGMISVGITFTANLSTAGDGPSGKAAALIAPVFAVLGFALEASSLVSAVDHPVAKITPAGDEPVLVDQTDPWLKAQMDQMAQAQAQGVEAHVDQYGRVQFVRPEPVEPEPVSLPVVHEPPPAEPVKVQRKPVSRSTGGLLDNGIIWATELNTARAQWPTVAEIMKEFPDMSRSTAKRVRAASPVGTDGTAKIEESVNA